MKDKLDKLFEMQEELNKRCGFDAKASREVFNPQDAGVWLNNFIEAITSEVQELKDCTFWKHWCQETKDGRRYVIGDLQNAKVEIIDILFFWISLAQCVGLTPDDVMRLYLQKLDVNHNRQDNNYSMENKTEDDNKGIR